MKTYKPKIILTALVLILLYIGSYANMRQNKSKTVLALTVNGCISQKVINYKGNKLMYIIHLPLIGIDKLFNEVKIESN